MPVKRPEVRVMPRWPSFAAFIVSLCAAAPAQAGHIPGRPCNDCASHAHWPEIDGVIQAATDGRRRLVGTRRSDELLGQHGSDVLLGMGGSDVVWGDSRPSGQPAGQRDLIRGGGGRDFIYASHGRNRIYGGRGNDAISAHFGRGLIDCGPGRDIYHVARSRRDDWRVRNCERVDYRSERQRGGGLKPLR
jgi:Ca2+-binding RTX toxin-like protein